MTMTTEELTQSVLERVQDLEKAIDGRLRYEQQVRETVRAWTAAYVGRVGFPPERDLQKTFIEKAKQLHELI